MTPPSALGIAALASCLATLAAACNGRHCGSDAACDLGTVCIGGACVAEFCTSSVDCPVGQHCGSNRQCLPGCAVASDCWAGQYCSDGACVPLPCTDTRTDCGWGSFCEDGVCRDAGDDYCAPCDGNEDCPRGVCWEGLYCGVDCTTRDDCPAGFDCLDVDFGDGTRLQCLSACWGH